MSSSNAATGDSTRDYVLGRELRVTILTSGDETDGRHDLTDSFMTADAATPLHMHTRYEERLWVISGSMTVWCGQDVAHLRAGDFFTIPRDTPHAVKAGPDGGQGAQHQLAGRIRRTHRPRRHPTASGHTGDRVGRRTVHGGECGTRRRRPGAAGCGSRGSVVECVRGRGSVRAALAAPRVNNCAGQEFSGPIPRVTTS